MFVILFGLSMDYHVFISAGSARRTTVACRPRTLSSTGSRRRQHGLQRRARDGRSVLDFATLPIIDMKEMASARAAVLIDATIVRRPAAASMRLLATGTGTSALARMAPAARARAEGRVGRHGGTRGLVTVDSAMTSRARVRGP